MGIMGFQMEVKGKREWRRQREKERDRESERHGGKS